MSNQIVLKPLDPSKAPPVQQKYAFFPPEEYLPPQVLIAINNTEQAKIEAKKAAIFFKEKGEQIIGVSVTSDGYLAKVYTISPEGIKRIWGKKLGKDGLFFPYIEIRPRPNIKPAAVLMPPSSQVD
ncbi:MAG: hypothetical protein JSS10_09385 [Verrucomicrobia bacterium]|nr:hypothetical protein [Verrucomicrobiota bacterium]